MPTTELGTVKLGTVKLGTVKNCVLSQWGVSFSPWNCVMSMSSSLSVFELANRKLSFKLSIFAIQSMFEPVKLTLAMENRQPITKLKSQQPSIQVNCIKQYYM